MTLVGLEESSTNEFTMMIGVQQQQQQQYHHITASSPNPLAHRGNVIVTASNNSSGADIKSSIQQQQQQQQQQVQQSQAQAKRKMYAQTTPYTDGSNQPASVARRNARERNRVKQVNNGFATLRQHIPQSLALALGGNTAGTQGGSRAGSKKLSKVETLRMAVEYIRNLQCLLDDEAASDGTSMSSGSSVGSPSSSNSSQSPQSQQIELKTESCDEDSLAHHQYQPQHSPVQQQQQQQPQQQHHHYQPQHSPQHHYHQLQPQQYSPQYIEQQHSPQQLQRLSPIYVPTPNSEASSSPTPSFVSEASSAGGSQGYGSASFGGAIYAVKADAYDSYEAMSPEDEDLLDYISLWQQGQ